MRIVQALDFLHASNPAQFESLSDLISPELIMTLLDEEGVATLRRRRMPMERLVWAIIGMAIFRHVPMTQLVNQILESCSMRAAGFPGTMLKQLNCIVWP